MRLLLGTHYFESHRGGIEIVAGQLARQFAARGATVTWLACDASASPDSSCGRAVPLPAWNFIERRLGVPLPIPGLRALARIWREVRRADAVQLHDSLYPTNVALLIAARLHGRPVVIVQHIGHVPYTNPWLRRLMALGNALVARPMLRAADRVVFISRTGADYFSTVRFRGPVQVIPNGVDGSIFRPRDDRASLIALRQDLGLPAHRPVVLFVGRFVDKKGLPILACLARTMPHVTFAFAGWGPLDPADWALPNVMVFRGLVQTGLAGLYQASDCLVLPSIGEGLPLVIQESLACGLPVLCGSETATAHEGIARWVTGLPLYPSNPEATAASFSTAIAATLADPGDRAARAAACTACYAWEKSAAAHLALIGDLLPGPSMTSAVATRCGG